MQTKLYLIIIILYSWTLIKSNPRFIHFPFLYSICMLLYFRYSALFSAYSLYLLYYSFVYIQTNPPIISFVYYQQCFEMSFDGLEDQLDIGYTPTIASNSRSAGMKKITRKSQAKPAPVNTKKQDQLDLLDQLLASPAKPVPKKITIQPPKNNNSFAAKNNNQIDSFFDEPSLPMSSKNTSKVDTTISQRPVTANPVKPSANSVQDTILEQSDSKPSSSFKFKRPQTAVVTTKPKSAEQQPDIIITPSVRMMKPPLRKRQSIPDKPREEVLHKTVGGGLTLPGEQPQKSTLTLVDDDSKFKPVPQLNKRRSSIQMNNSEFNLKLDDSYDLKKPINQTKQNLQIHISGPVNTDTKKTTDYSFNNTFADKPKQTKQQYKTKKLQILPQTKNIQQKKPLWQPERNTYTKQSNYDTKKFNEPQTLKSGLSHQQFEKEIDFIKRNYQQHIDSLQKNLQEQIRVNKQSRDRLMKQTNNMIQNERARMKKIHDEELDRVKQMGDWERKKLQENYKGQIQSLKSQVDKYSQMAQAPKLTNYTQSYNDRKEVQYLEERLRSERKLLEEKSKILDKRELQIQERIKQFNNKKRFEQQRLRDQQRRIFQMEVDTKKQILNEKRLLQDQKQNIATQLATLEMGNYKKSQNIEQLKAQIEMQRRQLNKQRSEIRNLNNHAMIEYQKKNQQLKQEKARLSRMEAQLIGKLKIVEAQATRQRINTTSPSKQNNWVNNGTYNSSFKTDQFAKRPMSVQKVSQQRKIENTQSRFMQLTMNVKQNLKLGKRGKDFDIDNYLMSMAHYTRSREDVH